MKAERDRIISKLYLSGTTLQAIGERYGLTREGVRQVLKRRGVPLAKLRDRGGRSKRYRPLSDDELQVVAMYIGGKFPAEIAKETGISPKAVSIIVRRAGLRPHGTGKQFDTPHRRATDARIVEMYLAGASTGQIIKSVPTVMSPPRIYDALRRHGVDPCRSPFRHHERPDIENVELGRHRGVK